MTEKDPEKKNNSITRFFSRLSQSINRLFQRRKSLISRFSAWQDVPLEISEEVNRYLEMRHVVEDEIKQVIFHAETTGDKLYQPDANRYLGKLRLGKATFYTDYSCGEEKFIVNLAYAHRSEIVG